MLYPLELFQFFIY